MNGRTVLGIICASAAVFCTAAVADEVKLSTSERAKRAQGDALSNPSVIKSVPVVPGLDGARAGAIRDMQHLRGARQAREAVEAMRGLRGGQAVDPLNQGLGASTPGNCLGNRCAKNSGPQGVPMPGSRNNRNDKYRGGGLAPEPEGSLHDMTGNLAGQDGGNRRPRRILGRQSESYSSSDGQSYRRESTTTEDGDEMVTERNNPGVGSSYVRTTTDRSSNTYTHAVITKDADGNVHKETQEGTMGPDGAPEEVGDDHGADPGAADQGVPGSGTGGGLAETHTIETAPGKGIRPPNARDPDFSLPRSPNRVNPGPEGATPQPRGPRLIVDQRSLVSDPDAIGRGPAGEYHGPGPGNKNHVNPPGPSDIPH